MTEYPHLIIILNEHARKGRKILGEIQSFLNDYSGTHQLYLTEYKGHAAEIAQSLSASQNNHMRLIIVGGDGTLNEVISGLEQAGLSLPVGYIPAGSGNDFARSHQLSSKAETAINRILSLKHPKSLDILTILHEEKKYAAVNSFGIGLDGRVNASLDRSKNKSQLGQFAYFAAILSAYRSQSPFSLKAQIENKTVQFPEILLAVCVNHKYFGGGIPIHPEADPEDSEFELVVAEKVNWVELMIILARVLMNQSHLSHKKLHTFKISACTLNTDTSQYGQTDGEWLEMNGNYQIQIKQRLFWIA
ncbi:diacylglycerol/lipid kinase family protein [Marinilactibacillus piezotolerans]|uniref:diacylglycerol/lipid kinase family protein n=1 Tax=Marinilactibacillus piezotolerans TaxID=258723 RepID=UPI0009B064A9|nr:YegS/Rv2252/BmrU family lipid kinase [Marinilactibacillus piezotolerans]